MKLWHGSPARGIQEFNLDNIRFESIEGYGTYLTPTYSIARSYAGAEGSVYQCEVRGAIFDGTSREEYKSLIQDISKKIKFDLTSLEYISSTIDGLISGEYQISDHDGYGMTWQILNVLDADDRYHELDNGDEIKEEIKELIRDYMDQHDAIKYHDKKLGLVVVCKNPTVIKIVDEVEIGSDQDLELI